MRSRRFPSLARTRGSRGDLRASGTDHLEARLGLGLGLGLGPGPGPGPGRGLSPARAVQMNFRNLIVYQQAIELLPIATGIASVLPQVYRDLGDQIRRASLSIPLNIAEGSGKTTVPDQRRFFAIARGSAMECGAIVDACASLSLIAADRAADANDRLASIVRMLSKLCR